MVPGDKKAPNSGYQSPFSHDDESASAGYYRVKLQKSGVTVELTAGQRAGMLRMTFPRKRPGVDPHRSEPRHLRGTVEDRLVAGPRRGRHRRSPAFTWSTAGPRSDISISPRAIRGPSTATQIISDGKPVVYDTLSFPQPHGSRRAEPAIPGQVQDESGRSHSWSRWPSRPSARPTP